MFAVALTAVALGSYAYWHGARTPSRVTCPSSRRAVVFVDTTNHAMALCESGKPIAVFNVRIGKQGTGKSREGDEKTPLGHYGLGEPRASTAHGLFIPIDYPTSEQRKLGFTGGAVGVHGPVRRVRWLGALVNTFDTTDGCVGLATDSEMLSIAKWVRDHRATEIELR